MDRTKLQNLQVLRFIAATLVVVSHAVLIPTAGEHSETDMPITALGYMGVVIFFIISGFIMIYTARGGFNSRAAAANFLTKRIARIAPIYWVMTVVSMSLYFIGSRVGCEHLNLLVYFISSMLFVASPRCDGILQPVLSQGWTLNYEMFFYVCFAASMLFRRKVGLTIIAVAFLTLAAIGLYNGGAYAIHRSGNPLLFYASPILLYFLAGVVIALLFERYEAVVSVQLPAWALVAVTTIASTALAYQTHILPAWLAWIGEAPLWLAMFAIVTLSVFAEPQRSSAATRGLERLGDASYSTYLVHNFVILGVRKVAVSLGFHLELVAFTVVSTAAALAAGLLLHLAVEKPITASLRTGLSRLGRRTRSEDASAKPLGTGNLAGS